MAENILTKILGSQRERDLKILAPLVRRINELEPDMLVLKDEQFPEKTEEYRRRYQEGESLDDLLPETFALVREAARRALGERILQGTTGFFIMDDPFVKADPARLQKQIKVLQRIAQLGWQVLYFSAKAEMKNALKAPIKHGSVNYIEIKGIFS